MNTKALPSLKIRRANSLDRAVWQEWMRAFATLVRLEAHAQIPVPSSHTQNETITQLVVQCDAMRVAFVEYSPTDTAAEPRIFIKPSAWSKITRSNILAAIHSYRQSHPLTAGRQKNQAA